MESLERLLEAILEGEEDDAKEAAREIGESADELSPVIARMTETMRYLGNQFEEMEIYLPEMMISANAMIAAMEILEPRLAQEGQGGHKGTVIMGSAPGDMHEIGKNIVATMLKADGFRVIDLGKNVSPEGFRESAKEYQADIIGISALMTTTMPGAKDVIDQLGEDRPKLKVMVGGAPTSEQWAKSIGADGWSENAAEAVILANRLLGLD